MESSVVHFERLQHLQGEMMFWEGKTTLLSVRLVLFESDGQAPNASFKLVGQHVTWRSNDVRWSWIIQLKENSKCEMYGRLPSFAVIFYAVLALQFGSWVEGHVESKACWADFACCKFQACFVFIWCTPQNDNMMMMMMMNLKNFTCPYGYCWGNLF